MEAWRETGAGRLELPVTVLETVGLATNRHAQRTFPITLPPNAFPVKPAA
jgi:hypothetical protein